MDVGWTHAAPSILAAFLASLVECVEALTIVLAVGSVRGWRSALGGSSAALVVLLAIVAVLGPALARIPLHTIQIAVGALLLLFGLRWLRKAVLRAAASSRRTTRPPPSPRKRPACGTIGGAGAWDMAAVAASFQITMLEGIEVVFIVIAIGAGGAGLLMPASLGALAALLVVIVLGLTVHRPLASVPENSLKFVVGVLLRRSAPSGSARASPFPGRAATGPSRA